MRITLNNVAGQLGVAICRNYLMPKLVFSDLTKDLYSPYQMNGRHQHDFELSD
jgi:hypothetical protein